ncbi:hypothetical protein IIM_01036 [Bacillus cereus VD107]|nr:hypothetical protein IIM_01036 [Bacillus cereus VD107]
MLKSIHNQLQGVNIDNVKIKAKEVVNATVDEFQKMVEDGKLSYEELTSIYLFRIQEHDQHGQPVGAVFVGKQFGEKELLNIGYAYEQQSKNRRSPKL